MIPDAITHSAHPAGPQVRRIRPKTPFELQSLVLRQLAAEGWEIKPEDLAVLSQYLTMRINRFGVYATDEISVTPEQYDAHLPDIDLSLNLVP
jgi:hypothetical protein